LSRTLPLPPQCLAEAYGRHLLERGGGLGRVGRKLAFIAHKDRGVRLGNEFGSMVGLEVEW